MGTLPWPWGPWPGKQSSPLGGWKGLEVPRHRGAAEAQLGLPQVRGVLQPPVLFCP